MADNLSITQGSGTTIAADDIGGVLHQRVKISQGADGSATDVSSAAPLNVTLANTGSNSNKILTTPDLPSGASTAAKQPALGTAGSASSDVITIQGVASMTKLLVTPDLPSGASTAAKQPALGTAGTASSDVITIQGITSMTPLVVASHAVTNAGTFAVQATCTNAGTFAVQDATLEGAVKNEDVASGAADPLMCAGQIRRDTPVANANVGTDGDYTNLIADNFGRTWVANASHGKTVLSTGGSAASSGNNTLITADATKRIKVKAFSLTTLSTTAMTCIFQDGASGTELWRCVLQASTGTSTGANLSVPLPDFLFATTANTLLNLNISSANAIHWSVSYILEV